MNKFLNQTIAGIDAAINIRVSLLTLSLREPALLIREIFSQNWDFSRIFSIFCHVERSSEAAMGGAGRRARACSDAEARNPLEYITVAK